jgi:heme exporter protein A
VLEVNDLTVRRGDRSVIAGLGFAIASGRCLQVIGANGSGKTTLLRVLCGLLEPDSGRILWRDRPVGTRTPEFQREFVYLGHHPPLKGDLTAIENLTFTAALRAIPRAGRDPAVSRALQRTEAVRFADRPVRTLSAGQRRRVALAMLCLSAAPIWLLDEPVTHLDAAGQALVARLVMEQLQDGGLVIAATHQDLGLPAASRDELTLGRRTT